jgi:RNA polymerase sigma factor (sigma-70 family)
VDDATGSPRPGLGQFPQLAAPTAPEARLSFPGFYRSQTPSLVAFVMWLGAGAEEAADVAQETMTRAWQNWEEIKLPHAWVRTVASREYRRRIAACHDEPAAEIPGHLLSPGMAADEASMLGPEQAWVLDLLRLLPYRQRQVMAWAYDGYTPAEIADYLNLDSGTVRVSLHKARETLKRHLKETLERHLKETPTHHLKGTPKRRPKGEGGRSR